MLRPGGIFVDRHCSGYHADAAELLARAQPVEADVEHARFQLLFETRDAYFKEFVEIAAYNRKKAHPFENRKSRLRAKIQNAAVERQPTQFPVKVPLFHLFFSIHI